MKKRKKRVKKLGNDKPYRKITRGKLGALPKEIDWRFKVTKAREQLSRFTSKLAEAINELEKLEYELNVYNMPQSDNP